LGYSSESAVLPIILTGSGLTLEVIKKAEKENALIIRVVESMGKFSLGELKSTSDRTKWIETDLMEWENGEVYNGKSLEIKLTPFGIKTWKVNL